MQINKNLKICRHYITVGRYCTSQCQTLPLLQFLAPLQRKLVQYASKLGNISNPTTYVILIVQACMLRQMLNLHCLLAQISNAYGLNLNADKTDYIQCIIYKENLSYCVFSLLPMLRFK